MKRRKFLGVASVGAGIALWPALVREAFGEQACNPLVRVAVLAAGFQRALTSGKPLLVFVVPADDGQKWVRGQAFGELLNFGGDRDLAPLGRVEVACATMAELKKLVPNAGNGEPLMVLVTPDRMPAGARQLDVELPVHTRDFAGGWEEAQKRDDALSDKRIAALGNLLRSAIGIDEKRVAAEAADARSRLVSKPPPGAKWAKSMGCGTDVEGEEPMMVGCGMGHVPRKSQRFLYFFTGRRF